MENATHEPRLELPSCLPLTPPASIAFGLTYGYNLRNPWWFEVGCPGHVLPGHTPHGATGEFLHEFA